MVTIRPAIVADENDLFELVRSFPTPTLPTLEQFSQALARKLPDPSSCVLVAERDARLVGYVAGYCHVTFYAGGTTAWVDELLVVEALRRNGIGKELMDAFEEWAKVQGSVLVSLATRGASAFYEHRGYSSAAGYYKKYFRPAG